MRLSRPLLAVLRFHRSQQGASTAEYGIAIAVMAAAAVVIRLSMRAGINTVTSSAYQRLNVSN